jgi:hypothetical protein
LKYIHLIHIVVSLKGLYTILILVDWEWRRKKVFVPVCEQSSDHDEAVTPAVNVTKPVSLSLTHRTNKLERFALAKLFSLV